MSSVLTFMVFFVLIIANAHARELCSEQYSHTDHISEALFDKASQLIIDNERQRFLTMLSCGLNINAGVDTRAGSNFLAVAILNNKVNFLTLLLDHGHDIEKRDGNYNTPLLVAINEGNREAIAILVDGGANIKATNKYNESAESLASQKGISLLHKRLNPPQFKHFAVSEEYKGRNKKLVLNQFSRPFRTRLNNAIAGSTPTFAGKYLVVRWGCGGGGCNSGAIIDASTGEVFGFPVSMSSVWPVKSELPQGEDQELIYKLNSRLMIFAGNVEADKMYLDSVLFYEFTGSEFKLLAVLPYGKSPDS